MRTASVAAILSLATAGSSLADVTAEEVWQNWQDVGAASGRTLDAVSALRSGDTLTVTGMIVLMQSSEGEVKGVVPQVNFRDTGDGRVEITLSDHYNFQMSMTPPSGETTSNSLAVQQNGLLLTASGAPDAINYDVMADSVSLTVQDFVVDAAPKDLRIDLELTSLLASYLVVQGDPIRVTSNFSGKSLRFAVDGTDGSGSGAIKATGQMSGLAGFANSPMMGMGGGKDFVAMLSGGFAADFAFTYNEGAMTIGVVDEKGSTTDISTTSKGGKLNFAMDNGNLAYGAAGHGVTVSVQGSAIPFPEVTAAYDEVSFDLRFPLVKAEEPQDFTFNTRLRGLTVSDFLWNMIDPGATLPRDPATLIIETKGKVRPLVDLLDETNMSEQLKSGPPVEVESFDVTDLQLSVAGAELLGDAALTFDNTQPLILDGITPMPTGKVNLSLTGANALLGKLQALGLVQPDMVMGFGMFSGMLAKPGPTPDSLVTEIDIQEGGRIFANGNPLPF